MTLPQAKLVIVGDGAVGKTSLLISYCKGTFSKEYVPTVFDNFSVRINVKDVDYQFLLCDTSGQETYDRLRPLAYPQTDIFFICCSVVIPVSFSNAMNVWKPELQHHRPEAPFFLVGTQVDLREDFEFVREMKKKPVSREEGVKLAKRMGAIKYVECSAKTKFNVTTLFKEALITALTKPEQVKEKKCVLL